MTNIELRLALSIRAAKLRVKVETHYDPKPIPSRAFDWSATTSNHDCDWDGECWVANEPVGYGADEDSAIASLLDQLEEDEDPMELTGDATDYSQGLTP